MDYYHFLEEFDTYNEWNRLQKKAEDDMWGHKDEKFSASPFIKGIDGEDTIDFGAGQPVPTAPSDDVIWMGESLLPNSDRVNSPSHYTSGKTEVIDIIEDAVKDAPSVNIYGMLQGAGAQVHAAGVVEGQSPRRSLRKPSWYLERLIKHYSRPAWR